MRTGPGQSITAQETKAHLIYIDFTSVFLRLLELLPLSDMNVLMKIETFDGQSDFVSSIEP